MESVSQLLLTYFKAFMHPFETQRTMRRQRERERWYQNQEGMDLIPVKKNNDKSLILNIEETISISWLMAGIYAFYEVFWIFLGLMFLEHHADLGLAYFLEGVLRTNIQVISKGFILFWILLRFAFFPVATWFYAKFWMVIIRFFANLFEYEEVGGGTEAKRQQDIERVADQIVCQSLTSYTLHLVPIFGKVLGHFLSIFYIYVGVRQNMGLSNMQSIAVIISPLIFMATVMLVWFLSILFAIGLI